MDKQRPTQFGRALGELGIQMIPSYSPQARGRSERMFATLQDCLPKELAAAGITDMAATNRFLKAQFLPDFNRRFTVEAAANGDAFVPLLGVSLDDIPCLKDERTVNRNNCVSYRGKTLQIPRVAGRCHYVKTQVLVHEYENGTMAIFHGPRRLADYQANGRMKQPASEAKQAAVAQPARGGGQPMCYKTGQFYLLPAELPRALSPNPEIPASTPQQ